MKTACTSRLAFLNPRDLLGFALYAAGLVLVLAPMGSAAAGDNAAAELRQSAPAQAPGRWRVAGDLVTARTDHTATLLPNGQVLVAGEGNNTTGLVASAELYDLATGIWTATGSMATARQQHTATLLPNGQVLVTGGLGASFGYLTSVELYDPATEMWTATHPFAPGRIYHTATLLRNGRVLVSGGLSQYGTLARAQVYKSAP